MINRPWIKIKDQHLSNSPIIIYTSILQLFVEIANVFGSCKFFEQWMLHELLPTNQNQYRRCLFTGNGNKQPKYFFGKIPLVGSLAGKENRYKDFNFIEYISYCWTFNGNILFIFLADFYLILVFNMMPRYQEVGTYR